MYRQGRPRQDHKSALENRARARYILLAMSRYIGTERAIILARGLGTRMQKRVEGVPLDDETNKLADEGVKGMIPIGRPFLDHALQAMLDGGVRQFCLIVPPEASSIRNYYKAVRRSLTAATISFAVQVEPLGTADAVAAGRQWAGDRPFMVFNSDNYYTPETVRALAAAQPPASIAFEREAMIEKSNIAPERIRGFAVLDIDKAGTIRRIIEKPQDPDAYARGGKLFLSMNCWLFTPEIFQACASIAAHPIRKEYELPAAVQHSIDKMHLRYRAVPLAEGVLDLTGRADIEPVRRLLANHQVRFPAPDLW